jgi:hypothetical protein
LLFEALRQLNVTHDREKLEMLGVALANSGAESFKDDDRKDLFVRFVRELTRQHINVLHRLLPGNFMSFSPLRRGERPSSAEDWDNNLKWSRKLSSSLK